MAKRKIFRGLLYSTLILSSLTSIATAGGVSYWMYNNASIELTAVSVPDLTQEIVPEDADVQGVAYDGSVEVTSVEQVQAYRNDTSQPLYLRNYLSAPSLGINLQIYEGTSNRVLSYGAGTIKPNQAIDSFANYAVAAHNFSDSQWGRGFSVLQYQPDIYGRVAYVSDGEYVYTYTLAAREHVYRDDSMKFTEDDYRQQFMQDHIKTLAPKEYQQTVVPERLYNPDESYVDNTENKEFVYGKLLTLYTCEVYWEDGQILSYNRIIVTGVMTDKKPLSAASEDVRNLFLDPEGNLTIPEEQSVPAEAQQQEEQARENKPQITTINFTQKPNEFEFQTKWRQAVAKDNTLPEKTLYSALGVFAASILGLIGLNLTKGKKRNEEQDLSEQNGSDPTQQNTSTKLSRRAR